jgi:glutamate 5-kinase
VEGRKRFLLASGQTLGLVKIDGGAAVALKNGGSLLPVGLIEVVGTFERGDALRIVGPNGEEIGRGLSNYASADLVRIIGRQSEEIEKILGYAYGDEVVHRSNMVLL